MDLGSSQGKYMSAQKGQLPGFGEAANPMMMGSKLQASIGS